MLTRMIRREFNGRDHVSVPRSRECGIRNKTFKFKNQTRVRAFALPAHSRHLTMREREGQDTWVDEHKLHKAIDPEAHMRV